jgi:hypothetical protein
MKIDNDIKLLIALILAIDIFLVALCYIANNIPIIQSVVFFFGLETICFIAFMLFDRLIQKAFKD